MAQTDGTRRVRLTTARCVLRPLAADDANALHELWTSAGVRRFLWDGEVISPERTLAVIEQSERMFSERGYGLWGAWLKNDRPQLVGFTGLWPFRAAQEIELLYGVAEPFWGRGYAAEIAAAVIEHCTGPLAMPVVRASTDAANVASVRVMAKLGMTFVRRDKVEGLDTVFCELTP
jgi:ribosomal-protein-alanine N-acetyltransferase